MLKLMKYLFLVSVMSLTINTNTAFSQVEKIGRIDVAGSMDSFIDHTLSDFASDISLKNYNKNTYQKYIFIKPVFCKKKIQKTDSGMS